MLLFQKTSHLISVLRAVASLTVPGGQEFHFPHFFPNFEHFFLLFLTLFLFSSSFWLSGWATRPLGKALATPLSVLAFRGGNDSLLYDVTSFMSYRGKNIYVRVNVGHDQLILSYSWVVSWGIPSRKPRREPGIIIAKCHIESIVIGNKS